MTGRADRWIRRSTVGCVALLALIAGTPSARVIADRYGRHERWGRLTKAAGAAGEFDRPASSSN